MRGSPRRCWPIFWRAGKAGGYPADIKLIYSAGGDLFNQAPNVNKMVQSLDGVEFLVVQDHFLTPTARYADIVLPATTFWERNDVHTPWAGAGHYAIFMKQAIEPTGECRNDMDIFTDLAERVGIDDYTDKSEMDWLRDLTKDVVDDFDAFAENGVARFAAPEDAVAFAREIRDPVNHKFTTPSGKIEIYSMAMAANPDPYGLGPMPPIPDLDSALSRRRGLSPQTVTPKSRARTHSIHSNQPVLGRVDRDDVWMHPADAKARGIVDGSVVRVFNARGSVVLPARVTDRIALGAVFNQGRRLVHPGCLRDRYQGLRQCADGGSIGSVRCDDLQHQPGGHRASSRTGIVVCGARGLRRDIAKSDISRGQLLGSLACVTEPAAARCLKPYDVTLLEHEVHDLRGQRLADTIPGQVERAQRCGIAAREAEGTELEAVEIGRELR